MKQGWMVAADFQASETQHKTFYFAVGNVCQLEAVSAVRSLPQIKPDSEIRASRRLASTEVVAIRLFADEIRPLN